MGEIKKIEVQGQQYGVADMLMRSVMGGNAQVIEWSHNHNMNDYKDAGTYRIKGERTGNPMTDNLPIMNQGSGHTIEGILHVFDSSLTSGSGKEDDCTVTQFLMLSNRVGGQEGDMYMRSGYGANKDSISWKPWEKYQTNMEVGVVSDSYLLNPSNPTEILKHGNGMYHIQDNGIYSGIYLGPKCMVGTGDDDWHISFQDATAIETFVMVVINNYAAAGDARCVTQIKFAVTNGGVFSMEKRSTNPGTTKELSLWESIGGGSSSSSSSGLPDGVSINIPQGANNGFIIESVGSTLKLGSGIIEAIGPGVHTLISGNSRISSGAKIGQLVDIGDYVSIGTGTIISGNTQIKGNNMSLFINTDMDSEPAVSEVKLGRGVYIGNSVNIGGNVRIHPLGNNAPGIAIGTNTEENDLKIEIDWVASKIIFSYCDKSAELQLA